MASPQLGTPNPGCPQRLHPRKSCKKDWLPRERGEPATSFLKPYSWSWEASKNLSSCAQDCTAGFLIFDQQLHVFKGKLRIMGNSRADTEPWKSMPSRHVMFVYIAANIDPSRTGPVSTLVFVYPGPSSHSECVSSTCWAELNFPQDPFSEAYIHCQSALHVLLPVIFLLLIFTVTNGAPFSLFANNSPTPHASVSHSIWNSGGVFLDHFIHGTVRGWRQVKGRENRGLNVHA